MLEITLVHESFDEEQEIFVTETATLELEHSLLSVSKWESEFQKPFLDPAEKTAEENLAYIRCMIMSPEYPSWALMELARNDDAVLKLREHMSASKTASTVREDPNPPRSPEKITSELIYYWMCKYQIPWAAENWHLSRLLMLIRMTAAKEAPPKKRNPATVAAERRAENLRRRAAAGSRG